MPRLGCHIPCRAVVLAAIAVSAYAVAAPAQAENGATARGQAAATIVAPLTVRPLADLDFGMVAATAGAGGTVTIAPLGGSSTRYSPGLSGVCAAACGLPHPARFGVTGEPGRNYQVSVPPRLMLSPAGAGGTPVVVDRLTVATASNPTDRRGTLTASGTDAFEVGGTLHVPASAAPARYTTQVPVIVDYL